MTETKDTHTQTDTHTHTDRQTDRQTQRHSYRHTYTDTHTHRHTHKGTLLVPLVGDFHYRQLAYTHNLDTLMTQLLI